MRIEKSEQFSRQMNSLKENLTDISLRLWGVVSGSWADTASDNFSYCFTFLQCDNICQSTLYCGQSFPVCVFICFLFLIDTFALLVVPSQLPPTVGTRYFPTWVGQKLSAIIIIIAAREQWMSPGVLSPTVLAIWVFHKWPLPAVEDAS